MFCQLLSKVVPRIKVECQINTRSLGLIHCAQNKVACFSNFSQKERKKNFGQQIQVERFISSPNVKVGLGHRFKKRIFSLIGDKAKVNGSAVLVYEMLADEISWKDFFECFELPDTFQSWFLAIQLHVWMCTLVTISEKNGRLFRNRVIESLWRDVEHRLEELKSEIPHSSERKKYLGQMTDQFQAALISYDEGILSNNDTVLAAAVWRTMFSFRYIHPSLLEKAVLYIRKQVSHLDSLPSDDLILNGSISFLPLSAIVKPVSDQRNI